MRAILAESGYFDQSLAAGAAGGAGERGGPAAPPDPLANLPMQPI